jgi:hypothetical protein
VKRKRLLLTGLLALLLAGGGCGDPAPAPPASGSAGGRSSSAPPFPSSSLAPAVSGWPVFTSAAGGYRLRYPPGWRAKESSGSGGPVLSLLPPQGAGISLLVTFTAPPETSAATSPNLRCRPVRVGRLRGSRCLDTVSQVVTTILQGGERWYVLTTSQRRPAAPAGAYDRVLASLRPT